MAETGQETKPLVQSVVHKRHARAVSYVKTNFNMGTVDYFYRDKPEQYFDDLDSEHGGVMIPYRKDNNGSPDNPINGKLNGLFFSAQSPPLYFSYFGQKRLLVKANVMLTPGYSIYFSDFYCLYSTHYVTVVVTKPRSESDEFCDVNLVEMDIYNNPFLTIKDGSIRAAQRPVIVEMFWTESVNIPSLSSDIRRFEMVDTKGQGRSKEGGLPNNKNCKICNV